MTQEEVERAFGDWMELQGQGRPLVRANEDWMNYAPPGKKKANSSAKLNYGEIIEGVYKDFKTNTPHVWRPANGETAQFTDAERQRLKGEADERAAVEKAKHEAALQAAIDFYYGLEPAPLTHPYLVKKKITNLGPIKIHNDDLIIPIFNIVTEQFQTYQRILPDGTKLFPADTVKKGGFMMPGAPAVRTKLNNSNGPVIVCEGYATADAVRQAAPEVPVIAALDAVNLKAVIEGLRRRNLLRTIIIAADNDTETEGNPGLTQATKAAQSQFNVKIAVPPPGDFWDLWDSEGVAAVQRALDEAKAPPPPEPVSPAPDVGQPKPEEAAKKKIQATPFVWTDPTAIPKRRWLYKPNYIRQFVSLLVSTGGIGKSSLVIAETLAMVSAKALLGITPEVQPEGRKLKVWYWNGEDPMEELQRRFAATCKYYHLTREDIGDRLFLDTGRVQPIIIAEEIRREVTVYVPIVKEVIATITENKIDVLNVDPFVTCHRVNENDNAAISRVAKAWAYIADVTHCAVTLVHHSRKTGGDGVTVEDGRGASALKDAVRTARSANTMTKAEAATAQISEAQRRFYFRVDTGKANLSPPAETADWFRLESVDLGNCEDGEWDSGDHVGVVTAWNYPTVTMPLITNADIKRVQQVIREGGPWRYDQQSKTEPWIGKAIAQVLRLDLESKLVKKAVATIVDAWLEEGLLTRVDQQSPNDRKMHPYVAAGTDVDVARSPEPGSPADGEEG